ncbi:ROK family protein [Occultella kanbiaonis]|uniref:ROK family protein n=1 Tax=Occultella kanbiaonis TaxID=2675754 RepID=UPI0013D46918|nr:ROK family protein [Occultella kanbiaonis]
MTKATGAGGADPSMLRRLNAELTLRTIREQGEPTRTELRTLTGLARTTLDESIKELNARGLIEQVEPLPSTAAGRPASRFRFRQGAGHVVGIGFDGARLVTALGDLRGTVLATDTQEVELDDAAPDLVTRVRDAVEACLTTAGVPRSSLRATSIGVPGVVSTDGRITRSWAVPSWHDLDLRTEAESVLQCPVFVENHARLAALGEHWQGVAQPCQDVVFLLTGLRLGVGVIVGGKLLRGRNGAAGEFGTIRDLHWGKPEDYMTELVELAGDKRPGHAAEQVFDAAAHGDQAASKFTTRFVRDLARGVRVIQHALDPEMIVLGGHLARSGDYLLNRLREEVNADVLFPATIELTRLGDDAITVGAIRRTLDYIDTLLLDQRWT